MCDELEKEFHKIHLLLTTNDDKNYYNNADIFYVKKLGADKEYYYNWKHTDKATLYRRYDDIYKKTHIFGYRGHVKLPVKKEIQIYGLYDLNQQCIQEKKRFNSYNIM